MNTRISHRLSRLPRLFASRSRSSGLALLVAGGFLGGIAGACVVVNQNHCALNEGECADGLVCDRCASANDGCVDPSALTNSACSYEVSGTSTEATATTETTTTSETTLDTTTTLEPTTTSDSDSETETETESESESESETSGVSCDPAEAINAECEAADPFKPYCVAANTCGSCEDFMTTNCSTLTGHATPACMAEIGRCVECTAEDAEKCTRDDSICDPYAGTCGSCFEHAQCPGSACDLTTGECMVDAVTVWVERKEWCVGPDGTEGKPYCNIAEALNEEYSRQQDLMIKKDIILRVKSGIGPQDKLGQAAGGYKVAILGVSQPRPQIIPTQAIHRLQASEGAIYFYDNFDLINYLPSGPFIDCKNADIYFDRVKIAGTEQVMATENCVIDIRRSVITDNTEGSTITEGELRLTNSFVTSNQIANFGTTFKLNDTVKVLINYSSIIGNTGSNSSGLQCALMGNTIAVRNSILLGDKPPVVDCEIFGENSLIAEGAEHEALLEQFKTVTELGIFRPKTSAESIRDLAVWELGDPTLDFDGIRRPGINGMTDYAGAVRP